MEPSASALPDVTIRDWPWILTNALIVLVAWAFTAAVAETPLLERPGPLLLPATLSVIVMALAWIPHVTVTSTTVYIRTLSRATEVELTDLIGIDYVTNPILRQRIPRLVLLDGSSTMLPGRGISWSGMTTANQRAETAIRARAAAIGNELAGPDASNE